MIDVLKNEKKTFNIALSSKSPKHLYRHQFKFNLFEVPFPQSQTTSSNKSLLQVSCSNTVLHCKCLHIVKNKYFMLF